VSASINVLTSERSAARFTSSEPSLHLPLPTGPSLSNTASLQETHLSIAPLECVPVNVPVNVPVGLSIDYEEIQLCNRVELKLRSRKESKLLVKIMHQKKVCLNFAGKEKNKTESAEQMNSCSSFTFYFKSH
jgi:hypothetical protein